MKSKYLVDVENEILKVVRRSKKAITKDEIIEKTRNRISKKYAEEVVFSRESLIVIDSIIDDYVKSHEFIEIIILLFIKELLIY